jgi:hypothetical protein
MGFGTPTNQGTTGHGAWTPGSGSSAASGASNNEPGFDPNTDITGRVLLFAFDEATEAAQQGVGAPMVFLAAAQAEGAVETPGSDPISVMSIELTP